MSNQHTAPPSGNFPTRHTTPILDRLARQEALQHELRGYAKDCIRTVPDLSETELGWLYDVSRSDTRSRHLNIDRFLDIGSRSTDPAVRARFPEFVRAFALRHEPIADVFTASDRETESNGAFDVAMHQFEHRPTVENQRHAIETGLRQIAETRAVVDAVRRVKVG